MQWVTSALVLLLTVSQLACAVYFVDVNSPKASDANPGTADLPLKTINRAAQLVQPGDMVVVKAGVYREHVRLVRSGKPGSTDNLCRRPTRLSYLDWRRPDNWMGTGGQ
jgi:hypothetical protein